jgi:hypothetical protein
VSFAEVRDALDSALRKEQEAAGKLFDQLVSGDISLTEWRDSMREMVRLVHLYSIAIAKGGFNRLTATDYGYVGQVIRAEYTFLERFARRLSTEELKLDGLSRSWAKLYAEAARYTFHQAQRQVMTAAGFTLERNVLHPAEHCAECLAATAQGWVPIGTLPPIGTRKCLRNCKCTLAFS